MLAGARGAGASPGAAAGPAGVVQTSADEDGRGGGTCLRSEKTGRGGKRFSSEYPLCCAPIFRDLWGIFRYIYPMDEWSFYHSKVTVDPRILDLCFETQIHHPDGRREVEYRFKEVVLFVPMFRRCSLREPYMEHFRMN